MRYAKHLFVALALLVAAPRLELAPDRAPQVQVLAQASADGFTVYGEEAILNSWFRTQAAYKPAGIYIALFTVCPTDSTGGTEASGGDYTRKQITQADAQWNAPAGTPRKITNVNAVTWSAVTWSGTIVCWGIMDQQAPGGNLLAYFDSVDKTVNVGDTVNFAGGAPGVIGVQVN
jgi:hypothetical protein